ncbi:MAG TPA: PLP-dependent transferase, partial [candidate division Zixibacteria bacterium]|nr:PLP-dependent transferase [candidate division Zixibacteria bacterium]
MNRNVSYGESQIHVETVLPKGGTARGRSGQPVVSDISLSTTYHAESAADHRARFGVRDSRVYTRFGHPNLEEVAARIALLEHAEAGLVFPSGMSAVTTTVLTFLRKGDHAIVQEDTFAQTRSFATRLPDQFGIDIDFVDATDPDRVKRALKDNTALIWIDTPANPTLSVVDIHAVATIGQERGIPVCVDSTFASPYLQNPLTLGASVVMHSGTKYLSGHSDTMCGAIASDARTIARIKETQIVLGGILDPFAAWRLNKGIKTLALRVQRQSDNALEIAEFLESHDRVRA